MLEHLNTLAERLQTVPLGAELQELAEKLRWRCFAGDDWGGWKLGKE